MLAWQVGLLDVAIFRISWKIPWFHKLTPYSYHISFFVIPPRLQLISSTTTTPKCTLHSVLLSLLLWLKFEGGSHVYIGAPLLEPKRGGNTAVRLMLRRRGSCMLLQYGQPVVNSSMALTSTVTWYAQIGKQLPAITLVYGRIKITEKTKHSLLETIALEAVSSAPKCFGRIFLRLQSNSLEFQYKKGQQIFQADALSRNYLPEVSSSEHDASLTNFILT